jgi:MbtH protein
MPAQDDDDRTFLVVLNDEEQYSIWPQDVQIPAGWRPEGMSGSRADCLAHIDQAWTDMRPLSLRKQMEQSAP